MRVVPRERRTHLQPIDLELRGDWLCDLAEFACDGVRQPVRILHVVLDLRRDVHDEQRAVQHECVSFCDGVVDRRLAVSRDAGCHRDEMHFRFNSRDGYRDCVVVCIHHPLVL